MNVTGTNVTYLDGGFVYQTPDGTLVYKIPGGDLYIASGDDANCTLPECPVDLSIYGYRASLPCSITVIAPYAICMLVQMVLGIRFKTWSYMVSMLLGCICEILGYVGRIILWDNPWNHAGFTMQIVLITIAPVFFSAAIYVMLYQIVNYISVEKSRFPPQWFYYFFIPADVISLILQAVGGTMSARTDGESQAGVDIALVGLGFQVFTITLFSIGAIDYMIRSKSVWKETKLSKTFLNFAFWLSLAVVLIQIRCAYRIYELSEGYSRDSEALRNQTDFIVLETVMLVSAAWCLVFAHPGPVFYSKKKRPQLEKQDKEEHSLYNGNGQAMEPQPSYGA